MGIVHCKISFGVRQSLLTHVQKQRLLHSRCQNKFYSAVVHCKINRDYFG